MSTVVFYVAWPGEYGARLFIKQCSQRVGSLQGELLVADVLCHLIPLQERVDGDEAEIVVEDGTVDDGHNGLCVARSSLVDSLARVVVVSHPQNARPKSRTPLLRLRLTAVPCLFSCKDIPRHHREVVGAQSFQCPVHLTAAIRQLLVDIKQLHLFREDYAANMISHKHRHVVGCGIPSGLARHVVVYGPTVDFQPLKGDVAHHVVFVITVDN